MQLIDSSDFDHVLNNKSIGLYTLCNKQGSHVQICNYGARVVSILVEDANGTYRDVVLGFDTIQDYLSTTEVYFGATIGRYANRLADAQFQLNGDVFPLEANNGVNSLHGGTHGFHQVVWKVVGSSSNQLMLKHRSPNGEGGFPGSLEVQVTYTLTEQNELAIEYKATTDVVTPVNLTNHCYFNLSGHKAETITDHILEIQADSYTPVDANLIPTQITSVANTPFDFRHAKRIGQDLKADNAQLKLTSGYDHNFVLNGSGKRSVGKVYSPESNITMEVITDEPGMQFFSGNFLDERNTGKHNSSYPQYSAFCLETQHYPNSPNRPDFPSTILEPSEVYSSYCGYRFGVKY